MLGYQIRVGSIEYFIIVLKRRYSEFLIQYCLMLAVRQNKKSEFTLDAGKIIFRPHGRDILAQLGRSVQTTVS